MRYDVLCCVMGGGNSTYSDLRKMEKQTMKKFLVEVMFGVSNVRELINPIRLDLLTIEKSLRSKRKEKKTKK